MNKKRWIIIALAVILVVAAGISSIGLSSEESETSENSSRFTNLMGGGEAYEEVIAEGNPTERVLVIPVEGVIGETNATYNHELTLEAVEQVRADQSIQAVLFEIDSPGGTVYHTREVYDRMQEVSEEVDVPIYASMGSTAASGGYYLSMAADEIYAGPETITGSIGVILSSYNLEGLYDNLGIEPVTIKSGEMKDMLSAGREMTSEEEEVLQTYINESFNAFIQAIVENRDIPEEEVRELSDGRIYSGQQAVDLGLVDHIGYGKDAVEDIKETHNLEGAQVFQLQSRQNSFSSFLPSVLTEIIGGENIPSSNETVETLEALKELEDVKLEYMMEGGV